MPVFALSIAINPVVMWVGLVRLVVLLAVFVFLLSLVVRLVILLLKKEKLDFKRHLSLIVIGLVVTVVLYLILSLYLNFIPASTIEPTFWK